MTAFDKLFNVKETNTDAENQRWLEQNGFKPFFETRDKWVASRNEMEFLLNTWVNAMPNGWKIVATLKDREWHVAMTHETFGKWLDLDAFTAKSPSAKEAVEGAMALFEQFLNGLATVIVGK